MARIADGIALDDIVTSEVVNGEAVNLDSIFGFSFHVLTSGTTMNGSMELQASNDGTNWETVSGSSEVIIGSSDDHLYNVSDAFYRFVRLSVTADANAITVVAHYKGKGV